MTEATRNVIWDEWLSEWVAKVAGTRISIARFHEATLAAHPAFERGMDRIRALMEAEGLTRDEAQGRVVKEAIKEVLSGRADQE